MNKANQTSKAYPIPEVLHVNEASATYQIKYQDTDALLTRLNQLRQEYNALYQTLTDQADYQAQATLLPQLIDSLGIFKNDAGANRLELIRRFAQCRDEISNSVDFIDSKALGELLGEQKSNWSRDLNNLRNKGKILAVRRIGGSGWLYPVNQIDVSSGCVYAELEQSIPRLKQIGMTDWDILIWLNTAQLTVMTVPPVILPKDDTLDNLLADFNAMPPPIKHPSIVPIELLEQGKKSDFLAQAEAQLGVEIIG